MMTRSVVMVIGVRRGSGRVISRWLTTAIRMALQISIAIRRVLPVGEK